MAGLVGAYEQDDLALVESLINEAAEAAMRENLAMQQRRDEQRAQKRESELRRGEFAARQLGPVWSVLEGRIREVESSKLWTRIMFDVETLRLANFYIEVNEADNGEMRLIMWNNNVSYTVDRISEFLHLKRLAFERKQEEERKKRILRLTYSLRERRINMEIGTQAAAFKVLEELIELDPENEQDHWDLYNEWKARFDVLMAEQERFEALKEGYRQAYLDYMKTSIEIDVRNRERALALQAKLDEVEIPVQILEYAVIGEYDLQRQIETRTVRVNHFERDGRDWSNWKWAVYDDGKIVRKEFMNPVSVTAEPKFYRPSEAHYTVCQAVQTPGGIVFAAPETDVRRQIEAAGFEDEPDAPERPAELEAYVAEQIEDSVCNTLLEA